MATVGVKGLTDITDLVRYSTGYMLINVANKWLINWLISHDLVRVSVVQASLSVITGCPGVWQATNEDCQIQVSCCSGGRQAGAGGHGFNGEHERWRTSSRRRVHSRTERHTGAGTTSSRLHTTIWTSRLPCRLQVGRSIDWRQNTLILLVQLKSRDKTPTTFTPPT